MKMSEKFKIEEEDERTILKGGGLGDLQVREPRSGRVARRRSHSYVEEKFFQMTKILDFAAICNKKRFSEWTHKLGLEVILLADSFVSFFPVIVLVCDCSPKFGEISDCRRDLTLRTRRI